MLKGLIKTSMEDTTLVNADGSIKVAEVAQIALTQLKTEDKLFSWETGQRVTPEKMDTQSLTMLEEMIDVTAGGVTTGLAYETVKIVGIAPTYAKKFPYETARTITENGHTIVWCSSSYKRSDTNKAGSSSDNDTVIEAIIFNTDGQETARKQYYNSSVAGCNHTNSMRVKALGNYVVVFTNYHNDTYCRRVGGAFTVSLDGQFVNTQDISTFITNTSVTYNEATSGTTAYHNSYNLEGIVITSDGTPTPVFKAYSNSSGSSYFIEVLRNTIAVGVVDRTVLRVVGKYLTWYDQTNGIKVYEVSNSGSMSLTTTSGLEKFKVTDASDKMFSLGDFTLLLKDDGTNTVVATNNVNNASNIPDNIVYSETLNRAITIPAYISSKQSVNQGDTVYTLVGELRTPTVLTLKIK